MQIDVKDKSILYCEVVRLLWCVSFGASLLVCLLWCVSSGPGMLCDSPETNTMEMLPTGLPTSNALSLVNVPSLVLSQVFLKFDSF